MSTSPQCPKKIEESSHYYCGVLKAKRCGYEEEICSFCPDLQEQLRCSATLKKAVDYAAQAHKGQYRKGTEIPYMIHLLRTWYYVRQMTEDEEEWAAALLHDTLEDTTVTVEELQREFGENVAALVLGETEKKREEYPASQTWQLRKSETIQRLRQWQQDETKTSVLHIAFGDKLANLFSLAFEYQIMKEQLWNKFNQQDKEKHGWYYGEMGKIFQACFQDGKEKELVEEYWTYYKEVFGKYEV